MNPAAASTNPSPPPVPVCPRCEGRPPLERYRRYELQTFDPLWLCPRCFGFWAVGDSLSRGVADPYDDHPALRAALPPRACKACAVPLKPNGDCPRCGGAGLAPGMCPTCGMQMASADQHGLVIDHCAPCRGTWFDTGEIVARFGLRPVQGLAASTVDESAPDPVPSTLLEIALLVLRALIFRF
jgi:Zn-finger nucleic acid-binding protein